MKRLKLLIVAFIACVCCLPALQVARSQQPTPNPITPSHSVTWQAGYQLQKERIADTTPAQYVWVVQPWFGTPAAGRSVPVAGFRRLEALD